MLSSLYEKQVVRFKLFVNVTQFCMSVRNAVDAKTKLNLKRGMGTKQLKLNANMTECLDVGSYSGRRRLNVFVYGCLVAC